MSEHLTTVPPDAFARLDAALAAYAQASGRTSERILQQKGAQVVYGNSDPRFGAVFDGLASLFLRQAPPEGSIRRAARQRGFRVGRRVLGGRLSDRALRRAAEMMGGEKSVLVSPNADGEGFRFVRRGVRTVRGRPRRVHFRFGRLSYAVGPNNVLRREGDRVLNFRAVATYFELHLREHGRRFLGAAWLFRKWRRLAQSDPRREAGVYKVLVNQNPRSSVNILGRAELTGDGQGNARLEIESRVPGTRGVGEGRGLFRQVVGYIARDIDLYLARVQRQQLAAQLQEAIA